ncbi:MAG: transcriptional repressor [Azoarcus sp.]|jgi:Fe2+ or Zn2+ uptake regulation protein|nr:transcriptional repressor [Azoarcus sp.]
MEEHQLIHKLRDAGLRPTIARLLLLKTLYESPDSHYVETLYRKLGRRGTPLGMSAIYRSLRDMQRAGLLVAVRDASHSVHYRPQPGAPPISIVCHGQAVTVSNPEIYTRILSAAAQAGLDLTGREFDLHVRSHWLNADCTPPGTKPETNTA